jgi:hypothetical protein
LQEHPREDPDDRRQEDLSKANEGFLVDGEKVAFEQLPDQGKDYVKD